MESREGYLFDPVVYAAQQIQRFVGKELKPTTQKGLGIAGEVRFDPTGIG